MSPLAIAAPVRTAAPEPERCSRCGHDSAPGLSYCEQCGSPLARARHALAGRGRFCGHCGQPLQGHAPADDARRAEAAAREGHHGSDGERKQVTVLFADIKGSLELLAQRDPEEARRLIEPVLDLMIRAVRDCGGTVNQVLGDGIMALFGAPHAQEDHAVRACQAALDMVEAIARHGAQLQRDSGLPPLQIRAGLNSGEALVAEIGSDARRDYTAVGQTTHVAARMEQLAAPGTVLLTAATLRLAQGWVEVRSHGRVPVKGLAEPVEAFELRGLLPSRSRLQIAAARGLTPFVGRDGPLAQLEAALARVRAGGGQVVGVVGEPGVGKSRLAWELIHSPRTEGCTVGETRPLAYGKAAPYQPVADLLRDYFRITDAHSPERIREKVADRLAGLGTAGAPALAPLLALLEAEGGEAGWAALDPLQRQRAILDACRRLLLCASRARPLVVLFEDLHWIDEETQRLLDALVAAVAHAPVLLLLTYRPGYRHAWGVHAHFREMQLQPLGTDGAQAMLSGLLGPSAELSALKHLLVERTDGNPLFLEESVRTLEETGAIAGRRGAYALRSPLYEVEVPGTVQAILAARVDRLPRQQKQLLQCASVLGKELRQDLLCDVSGLPEHQVQAQLAELEAAGFLQAHEALPGTYAFRHALTHEVVYRALLLEHRRALHGRVVEAIEQRSAHVTHEQVEALATHALHAQRWDKAARYGREAGRKAFARSAHGEAVRCFESALQALEQLPPGPGRLEARIDVRFELRNALYPIGQLARVHALLRDAEQLSRELGDGERLERGLSYLTHYYWATGNHRAAVATCEPLILAEGSRQDRARRLTGNWALGQAYYALGRHHDAVRFFRQVLDAVDDRVPVAHAGTHGLPGVFARSWLSRALADLGDHPAALSVASEGWRIAEATSHPFSCYVASQGLGYVELCRGEITAAMAWLQRSVDLCTEWNFVIGRPTAAALLGCALARAGRCREGIPLLTEALETGLALGVLFAHSLEAAWLAEAYLKAGRLEDAQRMAEHALGVALEHEERGYQACILLVQGDIAAAQGAHREREAVECFEQAMTLARSLDMQPLARHCEARLFG
jgi:class 3 adenylate cyclase/tetratricopeptide (TPR) repeat protein